MARHEDVTILLGMQISTILTCNQRQSVSKFTQTFHCWTDPSVFEHQGKKDVVHVFSNVVRRQIGTRTPTVEYISSHPQILFMLLKG